MEDRRAQNANHNGKDMNRLIVIAVAAHFQFLANGVAFCAVLPEDFHPFYRRLKLALEQSNYKAVTDITCFPLRVYNYNEGIPRNRREYVVTKQLFEKRSLGKKLLAEQRAVQDFNPETHLWTVIYSDFRDIIIRNENPAHLANLDENASFYDEKKRRVMILELAFEKRNGSWCWAEAALIP
ncbi:hypothetical protein E4K72_18000 [Oxalobacteraceae bacterium OM1]|nr:hypothetical protein E4K72_18000 [Oxalobacteraceae bacterium OM1]